VTGRFQSTRRSDGGPADRSGRVAGDARADGRRSRGRVDPAQASTDATTAEPNVSVRDPAEAARTIALRQLEVRERSRHELADTLRRRGVADDVAAEVLDGLTRVELLDDARFARSWVESRRRTKGLSHRMLAVELMRKGISPAVAEEALGQVDEVHEQLLARRVADRKVGVLSSVAPEVVVRRVAGQLARKGYGAAMAFGTAVAAVRAATSSGADEQDEWGRPDIG